MKHKITRKHMTPEVFTQIRLLLDNGVKHDVIAEVAGRSLTTVKRIEPCQTFEEYQAMIREYNANHRPTVTQVIEKAVEGRTRTELDVLLGIESLLEQNLAETQALREDMLERTL